MSLNIGAFALEIPHYQLARMKQLEDMQARSLDRDVKKIVKQNSTVDDGDVVDKSDMPSK